MRFSVQPRDRIFVKGYGILSIAKNVVKILVKISVRASVVNIVRNFLIMLKNLQQMHLKLLH